MIEHREVLILLAPTPDTTKRQHPNTAPFPRGDTPTRRCRLASHPAAVVHLEHITSLQAVTPRSRSQVSLKWFGSPPSSYLQDDDKLMTRHTLSERAAQHLRKIRDAWRAEEAEASARFEALRDELPLQARVTRGVAIDNLQLTDIEAAHGGNLKLKLQASFDLQHGPFSLRSGAPVTLWVDRPDDPDSSWDATLAHFKKDTVTLYLDRETLPRWLEQRRVHLDQAMRDVTFERGLQALDTLQNASREHASLRELAYGDPLETTPKPKPQDTDSHQFFDKSLHHHQRLAIRHALPQKGESPPLTLIHGPPGTGKTRTLIELIAQAAHRGERVLATAASNLATDNLAERLMAHTSLRVVRIGHPARVSDAAIEATLDHQLERHPLFELAQGWMREAHAIRQRTWIKLDRGNLSRDERRENLATASQLMRDARTQLRLAEEAILDRAQVVCVTASNARHRSLNRLDFDRVVLDEATQASDPVAWIALLQAPHLVLAGDPRQLPPTILSELARPTLSTTLFERLSARAPQHLIMLTEQHRMNTTLMSFPSEQSYEGKLTAHPDVASISLADLDQLLPDPSREGDILFMDTAGKGWEEERHETSQSLFNLEQARRTASEVRRLMSRGIDPRHVAIITPYSAQRALLAQELREEVEERGLEVASIDGFQGREKEVIVLDLVRSNTRGELGFLTDLRRINVALTRAKRFLMIVADSATLGDHPYYAALLDYIQAHGNWSSAWNDDAAPL